jgi:multidrug resistance efflux pump
MSLPRIALVVAVLTAIFCFSVWQFASKTQKASDAAYAQSDLAKVMVEINHGK